MRTFVTMHAAAVIAVVVIAGGPPLVRAQERPSSSATSGQLQQQGDSARSFWVSLGLSSGRAALNCAFCSGRARPSYAGTLAFGGRFRSRRRYGIELQGWRYENSVVTQRAFAFTPMVQFYPLSRYSLFLKGGAGVASFTSSDGVDRLSSTGPVVLVGAGFEWPLTPNYVLAPYVSFLDGAFGSLRFNDEVVTKSSGVMLLQTGVSIALR